VPFRHLTVGAASGSWWTGDLSGGYSNSGVQPEAIQREGGPPGYMNLELTGNRYLETYRATGQHESEQMTLSVNSPFFRSWYEKLAAWDDRMAQQEERNWRAVPARSTSTTSGDMNLLTREDVTADTYLTANVWNGQTATKVTVQIDGRAPMTAERTQKAEGEGVLEGAEYGDPLALVRQLQVGRYALESRSGNERAQGWEAFRGDKFGPGPAQPIDRGLWADQSSHLWRLPIPQDLPFGGHTAVVTATDPSGRQFEETINFEIVKERPQPFFRKRFFPEDGTRKAS
jgi:hypothetical protein